MYKGEIMKWLRSVQNLLLVGPHFLVTAANRETEELIWWSLNPALKQETAFKQLTGGRHWKCAWRCRKRKKSQFFNTSPCFQTFWLFVFSKFHDQLVIAKEKAIKERNAGKGKREADLVPRVLSFRGRVGEKPGKKVEEGHIIFSLPREGKLMRPSIFKTTSHSESSEVKIMPDEILTRQVGLMYVPSRPSHYVQNQRICINGVFLLSGLNLGKM